MRKTFWTSCTLVLAVGCGLKAAAQQPLSWEQLRQRFEQNNPTLLAGKLNVDESKAQEITAYLRPNPQLTVTTDGTQIAPGDSGVWRPFAGTSFSPGCSRST